MIPPVSTALHHELLQQSLHHPLLQHGLVTFLWFFIFSKLAPAALVSMRGALRLEQVSTQRIRTALPRLRPWAVSETIDDQGPHSLVYSSTHPRREVY